MRKNKSVIDLTLDMVSLLPPDCVECCFWETYGAAVPGVCREPGGKSQWISEIISSGFIPGKVLLVDGSFAGFIQFAPSESVPRLKKLPYPSPDPDSIYITCVYVTPELRGRGYGKALLMESLKSLSGSDWVAVETHGMRTEMYFPPGPQGFFESCGFRKIKDHPHAPLLRIDVRSLALWFRRALSAVRGVVLLPSGQQSSRGCEKPCT